MDKNNARLAFEELIELYPITSLSENSSLFRQCFGKSNEEILNILKNSKFTCGLSIICSSAASITASLIVG